MSKKPTPAAKAPKRQRPSALARMAAINFFVLVILYILAEGIGERYWLTLLFTHCPPLLWTPVTILLSLAAMVGRNPGALGWCGAAWLLLVPILGIHIPLHRPARDAKDLRVLTFNILMGKRGAPEIAKTIRRVDADVVVLEEVCGSATVPDPLPTLRTALREYTIVREGEVAIATKLPLRKVRSVPMMYSRRMLLGVVEWQGKPVTVAAVHFNISAGGRSLKIGRGMPEYLHGTEKAREHQADILLRECAQISGPLIVAGDFNTTPRGPLYHRLTSNLRDSFADVGFGPGWSYSAEYPCLRIDYILTSKDIRATRSYVLSDQTSDHRPVLSYLQVGSQD